MTLEDPFFVVKDEVCKALNKTRSLFQRWLELEAHAASAGPGSRTQTPSAPGNCVLGVVGGVGTPVSPKEELQWTCTELRNSLRSIEWDLEDLEETISIVEKNPRKFKIDAGELASRRTFILQTKEEVKCMKNRLSSATATQNQSDLVGDCEVEINTPGSAVLPLATSVGGKMAGNSGGGSTRYSRLVNQADDSPSHSNNTYQATMLHQQSVMTQQDSQLDELASSMGVLKQMSRQVGQEVDEQAVMLDDFGHEMEHTQSKMDNTLNRIARVMHLTNDKRQWTAIGVLTCVLIVVVLLFIWL